MRPTPHSFAASLSVLLGAAWLTAWHSFSPPAVPSAAGEVWFGDVGVFARFGEALLGGDIAAVYADSWNQAGPLQVISSALSVRLAEAVGLPWGPSIVMFLVLSLNLGIAGWTTQWLLAVTRVSPRFASVAPWMPTAVIVMIVATGLVSPFFSIGHWMQMPVIGLWLMAVRWISHPVVSGALVGIACLLEPWAVFGFPFLLLATTWAGRAAALGSATLVTAAGWLPFALQPDFALFKLAWPLLDGSPWTLVLEPGSTFPWSLRILQSLIVLGVLIVLWLRLGGRIPLAWFAVAASAAMLLARVAFDPKTGNYYTAPSAILILSLLACCLMASSTRSFGLAAGWWMAIPYNAKFLGDFTAPLMSLLVLLITVMIAPREWARVSVSPETTTNDASTCRR